MKREKVLFIYNPQAGKGTLKNKISDVLEIFMKFNLEITVYATKEAGEATEIVEAKGTEYTRVICSGGDGTLHEVLNGLMMIPEEKRPACGYIPTGTVNDFANGLKIPKRVLPAAEIAAGFFGKKYDVGEMNGQFFSYVAAFGAFTSVSYETSQVAKNILGKTAYLLDGISKLNLIKSIPVKACTEKETWEGDCILGIVSNAKSIGGIKTMFKKKKVELDDGYLDCIFVSTPKNPLELNQVMNFLLTGEENAMVHMMQCEKIEIDTEEDVAYTLDGENGGAYKKTVITCHKQAITYYHGF